MESFSTRSKGDTKRSRNEKRRLLPLSRLLYGLWKSAASITSISCWCRTGRPAGRIIVKSAFSSNILIFRPFLGFSPLEGWFALVAEIISSRAEEVFSLAEMSAPLESKLSVRAENISAAAEKIFSPAEKISAIAERLFSPAETRAPLRNSQRLLRKRFPHLRRSFRLLPNCSRLWS